jgi:hypothetical protein
MRWMAWFNILLTSAMVTIALEQATQNILCSLAAGSSIIAIATMVHEIVAALRKA